MGSPIAGNGGSGKRALSSLMWQFWSLWVRGMHNEGVLTFYVRDCTHWKMFALTKHHCARDQRRFGKDHCWLSSTFDVNAYIRRVANRDDFVFDPTKQREMHMFVVNYGSSGSTNVHWKQELQEALRHAQSLR